MEYLDQYVSTPCGPTLMCWEDRYSAGVWAVVAESNVVAEIQNKADGGDVESLSIHHYLCNPDWLPFVTAETLTQALTELDGRLRLYHGDKQSRGIWNNLVSKVEANIFQRRLLPSIFGITDEKLFVPKTFEEAKVKDIPCLAD